MSSVAFLHFFTAWSFNRRTSQAEYTFIIGADDLCLIRGLTESSLSEPGGYTSFVFLAMIARSWNSRRESAANRSLELSNSLSIGASTQGVIYE